jgi:ATP-dependent exoDNAse (exonuclease V) beta subunit
VHRAKGLEFPVVILADPTASATPRQPSRHVDPARRLWLEPLCGSVPPELREAASLEMRRDADEAVRLAYVAATRARDLLVVPAIGDADASDEEVDGWVGMMNAAVYPPRERRRAPEIAAGCPPFGEDSVYERPEKCDKASGASVKPGLHRPQAGEHAIVWWDPRALELDRQEEVGLRQERILVADEGGAVAEEGVKAHERWQAARRETLERGAEPTLRVEAVTAIAAAGRGADERARPGEAGVGAEERARAEEQAGAEETAAPLAEVLVEEAALDRSDRPGGARFGTLVHAILAAVDLDAGEAGVRAAAEAQGRVVGASAEEVAAAAKAVAATLAHPLLRRAACCTTSGSLRREVPILLRLEDGTLADGVVDLAFREEDGSPSWTVVDFKTDREIAGQRPRYEAQVRLYTTAVSRATGEPARGVLLAV